MKKAVKVNSAGFFILWRPLVDALRTMPRAEMSLLLLDEVQIYNLAIDNRHCYQLSFRNYNVILGRDALVNGQIISFLATVIFMLMMVPAASDAGFNYKPPNLTFKDDQGTVVGSFSHDFHLQIYKCNDCHIKLFPFGKGKRMSMADMDAGKSCGACHNGKIAFATKPTCAKCHRKK
jgi:c(7)-type cytochrome triheme protein